MALMTGEQVEVTRSVQKRDRLPHRAAGCAGNHPFLIASFPTHWGYDFETGEWLPGTREVPLVEGVNGVDRSLSPGPLLAMVGRKGGVVVHESDSRLPDRFRKPVRKMANTKGRFVYYPCWVQWDVMGGDAELVPVGDAHREFRRVLRDEGIVPEISRMMKQRAIRQARSRRDEAVNLHGSSPANAGLAEKVRRAQAEVVAIEQEITIEAAYEVLDGYSKPKPKPKRPRRAQAEAV